MFMEDNAMSSKRNRRGPQKRNKIFVSWSGPNSKEFAK